MTNLQEILKVALAETFIFYLKSHNYHWNIEGPNFTQYHSFLGDLYDEVFDSIDPLAEHIRTLDVYVPGSCERFKQLSKIQDELLIRTPKEMFNNLLLDNSILIGTLNEAFQAATEANKQGIANFLADRIDIHEKHNWMIRSLLKNE